jgi:electron transport complex protein RnfD
MGSIFMLYELMAGGLVLGAFFMATDYVTSPITPVGRLIFGVGCGGITMLIRYFGSYPEGVSFAILIMNLLVWYIDRFTKPVKFGGGKNVGKQ